MKNEALINFFANTNSPFSITINGFSMSPLLASGDIVQVIRQNDYSIGDVLVFLYNRRVLLVHRLILKKDGMYYCKGDNAYQMEPIKKSDIYGKVLSINSCTSVKAGVIDRLLCRLSYLVHQRFIACNYSIKRTNKTIIYNIYRIVRNAMYSNK